jgi:hypothetical protein
MKKEQQSAPQEETDASLANLDATLDILAKQIDDLRVLRSSLAAGLQQREERLYSIINQPPAGLVSPANQISRRT